MRLCRVPCIGMHARMQAASFDLTLVGTQMKWADTEVQQVQVSVQVGALKRQVVIINARLEPYPSCTHTKVRLPKLHVKHAEGVDLEIQPHDTDNLTMSTAFFLNTSTLFGDYYNAFIRRYHL